MPRQPALNPIQVREMFTMRAAGHTKSFLATYFSVDEHTIGHYLDPALRKRNARKTVERWKKTWAAMSESERDEHRRIANIKRRHRRIKARQQRAKVTEILAAKPVSLLSFSRGLVACSTKEA